VCATSQLAEVRRENILLKEELANEKNRQLHADSQI
jgi:hypothetical protein